MFESIFTQIARSSTVTYEREDFILEGITTMPVSIHLLTEKYKGVMLKASYELGQHNLAEITFSIINEHWIPPFQLTKREIAQRLFRPKNSLWKIDCQDLGLKEVLADFLQQTGLTKHAKGTLLDPEITGAYDGFNYKFYTRYYLGFADKEHTILPMLAFHKLMIDYLIQR